MLPKKIHIGHTPNILIRIHTHFPYVCNRQKFCIIIITGGAEMCNLSRACAMKLIANLFEAFGPRSVNSGYIFPLLEIKYQSFSP
jgi:hypothetical protein